MQATPLFTDSRLVDVHRRLLKYYGAPPERELWDPLTQFIYSVLSSRTRTEVSHAVLRTMRERSGRGKSCAMLPFPTLKTLFGR